MKTVLNGIKEENPVFVLLLGLCSTLAVTTKFENAYMMGLCLTIVLVFSNLVISCIKSLVPNNVRIPVYILIIGTFVTIIEIILKNYIPTLYNVLGIYLPLIVVNCIVLGRAMNVASKESVLKSTLDGIGIGLGYTLALMLVAAIREILGTGIITLMDSVSSITGYIAIYRIIPENSLFPLSIFTSPAGAFLTLGFLMGLFNYLKNKKEVKHESH